MPPSDRPTLKQALLITLGGLVFGFFSCVGALTSVGSNFTSNVLSELGIAGFILGMLVMLVGIVLVLWVAVRPFFRKSPPASDAPTDQEPHA